MTTPDRAIIDYIEALDSSGLGPEDFGLQSWTSGVRALRRFIRGEVTAPRSTLVLGFQRHLQQIQAQREVTPLPQPGGGTLYVATERGTRLVDLIRRRPDLTPTNFDIRQNDAFALFQIIQDPGMAEQDLDVVNPRGAIIALRQRGLIEPV